MKFKFQDRVKVTTGFYEGFNGTIQEYKAPVLFIGEEMFDHRYLVSIGYYTAEVTKYKEVVIDEKDLTERKV